MLAKCNGKYKGAIRLPQSTQKTVGRRTPKKVRFSMHAVHVHPQKCIIYVFNFKTQTMTKRSPEAFSADTDLTSRCSLPAEPSPQNSMRWILLNLAAVGQTSLSSEHSVVCSPVAGDHLSLNALNGSFTS